MIAVKRLYEPAVKADGYRILVDRLWPRGIKKEAADIDLWMKEIAPSTELRTWFHKDTTQWTEFKKRYKAELKNNPALEGLQQLLKEHKHVTFLYTAKDEKHNHALVIVEFLRTAFV